MSWSTLATMIFAIGSVYGGLVLLLTIAMKRQKQEEE